MVIYLLSCVKSLACSRRSDSGERCEVKRSAKKIKAREGRGERGNSTSLPRPPLLFIAFFTSHRSPLSERLEQAKILDTKVTSSLREHPVFSAQVSIGPKKPDALAG